MLSSMLQLGKSVIRVAVEKIFLFHWLFDTQRFGLPEGRVHYINNWLLQPSGLLTYLLIRRMLYCSSEHFIDTLPRGWIPYHHL